jgi:hypothetical protein
MPLYLSCKQLASNLVTTTQTENRRPVFKLKIGKMFKGMAKIKQINQVQKTYEGRKVEQPFTIARKSLTILNT